MTKVLITGGAGYIGSHTCLELLQAGHDIVVVDNFANSKPDSLKRVKKLTGRDFVVEECDILDRSRLSDIIKRENVEAVIHFAGLKAVGESVEWPLDYYLNNVVGTQSLLAVLSTLNIKKFVFSSSATVYGEPNFLPLTEAHSLSVTNPYGRTKLIVEGMLQDLYASDTSWSISILRYFNPCGAHKSGEIGEDPSGIPNNLMPFIAQVATGRRDQLNIFGGDYDTHDGTGVRDYIHVVDLAKAHVKALFSLSEGAGCVPVNLGTGTGYSVLDIVKAFKKACGKDIPYKIVERRPGDIASCYANPAFSEKHLGWRAERGIEMMCEDHWRWQISNPSGYSHDA